MRTRRTARRAVAALLLLAFPRSGGAEEAAGLIGFYYGESDLTNLKDVEILDHLDQHWDADSGRGGAWSGKWHGWLTPPATGGYQFEIETRGDASLEIDGALAAGTVTMQAGKRHAITLVYRHANIGDSHLRVYWRGAGIEKQIIPEACLSHDRGEEARLGYVPIVASPEQIAGFDRSRVATASCEHVLVYGETGKFAGWPANKGIWSWGDEVLAAFNTGEFKEQTRGHSIDHARPVRNVFARSVDGGLTWTIEPITGIGRRDAANVPPAAPIPFDHPDLAIYVNRDRFHVSTDRGHTWSASHPLPKVGEELTARTDYLVQGPRECLFFLSARLPGIQSGMEDRAYCAATTDGGLTISLRGWMTADPARSVMPATVRCGPDHLVSLLRRREDRVEDGRERVRNWIEAVESRDDGASWAYLSHVADTDDGRRNGNPPSLVRLRDGRLAAVYGYRAFPYGIRARISTDSGASWGSEIHLRDDGRMGDLGYCRSVLRSDGRVLSIYYIATHERPHHHIAATLWNPDAITLPVK